MILVSLLTLAGVHSFVACLQVEVEVQLEVQQNSHDFVRIRFVAAICCMPPNSAGMLKF